MADLRKYLLTRATPGEWTVEADAATDLSDEELALEVVREKIFRGFYQGVCVADAAIDAVCALFCSQLKEQYRVRRRDTV